MIGLIRQWLTAVVLVTMLLSVAQTLVPEGTVRKITSFIGGLLLLLVMLQPLLRTDLGACASTRRTMPPPLKSGRRNWRARRTRLWRKA